MFKNILLLQKKQQRFLFSILKSTIGIDFMKMVTNSYVYSCGTPSLPRPEGRTLSLGVSQGDNTIVSHFISGAVECSMTHIAFVFRTPADLATNAPNPFIKPLRLSLFRYQLAYFVNCFEYWFEMHPFRWILFVVCMEVELRRRCCVWCNSEAVIHLHNPSTSVGNMEAVNHIESV